MPELAMDPENPSQDGGNASEVVVCATPEPGGEANCGEQCGQVLIGIVFMLLGLFWLLVPLALRRNGVEAGGLLVLRVLGGVIMAFGLVALCFPLRRCCC
ncbi:hypothetical protein ACP70R_018069 [Stipagrostis hirtigluma subsp. patula]